MNYTLESSFLEDDSFGTILWAEKLLAGFVIGSDERLGLNKCSASEKKLIKLLCRCFQVDYIDSGQKCYIQKTVDSRSPILTIKDMLTQNKIDKNFSTFKNKFHENFSDFPKEFVAFQTLPTDKEDFSKQSQKPTNKEVSQHELSMRSVQSRCSSISSESRSKRGDMNRKIKPADSDDGSSALENKDNDSDSRQDKDSTNRSKKSSNHKDIENKENVSTDGTKRDHTSIGFELNCQDLDPKSIKNFSIHGLQEKNQSPINTNTSNKDEEVEKSNIEDDDEGHKSANKVHAISNIKELEKCKWTRKTIDDTSRLPSVYHILFVILEEGQTHQLKTVVNKHKGVTRIKIVKKLGGFIILDSESNAELLFHSLSPIYGVYPMKDIPKFIQKDQLRTEICFMEGVRPLKTTSVAERFIYKHLGFK